ncbi:MAG: DinB family protein [Flavobacteriaceae bacterium]
MNFSLSVLTNTRRFFKNYLETVSLNDLNKIPNGFNNNIIWNIGHIVATQQLIAYKLSGLPMQVSNALVDKYKKGTKPQGNASQADVDEIKTLLNTTLDKLIADYSNNVFTEFAEYTVSTTGNTLTNIDEALEFITFHEGMHLGYIMAQLRVLKG